MTPALTVFSPAQVRALAAGDRVLVLGCSAAPHAAVKKDEVALLGLFDKHLLVPLPDYAARRVRSSCKLRPMLALHVGI